MKFKTAAGLLTAGAILACSSAAFADPPPQRPLGDSRFIASVPFPGFPEGMAVHKGRIYVSGPAAFGAGPSTVFVYDLDSGALVNTIAIANEPFPGGASCLAFGDNDDLYVIVEALGIVKIDLNTNVQSIYAGPFPFVFHSAFAPGPELLNDLAFDKSGNLYITDSFQATIWRVPKGGGQPQVWLQDAQIDGFFGPNGIRIDQKSDNLYFTVTFNGNFGGPGSIYKVPLKDNPTFADVQLVHTYTPFAAPDGIAFGKSGKLYVCLAGYSQISVIDADNPNPGANEVARYSGPAQTANPSAPLPWANPANIAFDDKNGRIIVTNHASLIMPTNPALFAIFDVFVDDTAGKLFKAGGGDLPQ
jgi:sugar lactone lactonase YvrE